MLFAVLTFFHGRVVHSRTFGQFSQAESFYRWRCANLNPADPAYPADRVRLCSGSFVTVNEKGAVVAAPPEAVSTPFEGTDDDKPTRRPRGRPVPPPQP